jgi:hypothetical protein
MGAWGALKLLLKRYAEAEAEVERLEIKLWVAERAEAEVARLQRELTEARADKLQAQRDRERAEVEVARLRAALKTAREYVPRQAVVTLELCDAALRGEGEK